MNNHIKLTIQSLIATYPLYSKEDILTLDSLAVYADPEAFNLITKFLYSVWYLDGKDSLTFLQQSLSILEEESTHHEQPAQSFYYSVTDGYILQPLTGNIEATNLTHAYELVSDIYASELSVSESDLHITIK